jgi:hypothetical protein
MSKKNEDPVLVVQGERLKAEEKSRELDAARQ